MFEIIALIIIVALDQASKHIVTIFLAYGETIPVIKGVFHLTLVHNTGIAFGMFKNQAHLFAFLSIITISFIIHCVINRREKEKIHKWEKFALFLILAGAIGNLIDRLRFGYVIDFLDFRIWPVFNVADSAITVGILIIIIQYLRLTPKWKTIP